MRADEGLDLDRIHALMMAALDEECVPGDRAELDRSLAQYPELAREWDRLCRLKEVTMTMAVRQPGEEVWDRYRATGLHRAERGIAWALLLFGVSVLGAWGLWRWVEALIAAEMPTMIKVATLALVGGGVLLTVSVIRERWLLHRKDPYSRGVTR